MELILASASPRRKDILTKFGYSFKICESDFNETEDNLSPKELCVFNALNKAKSVSERLKDNNVVVLGADTIVCIEDKILGKSKNEQKAFEMLSRLSNKTHVVYTGYAIVSGERTVTGIDETLVTFNDLNGAQINEYIRLFNPLDKAGAYGVQDDYNLVKNYNGSLYNVIGLPIEKIMQELKGFGLNK